MLKTLIVKIIRIRIRRFINIIKRGVWLHAHVYRLQTRPSLGVDRKRKP